MATRPMIAIVEDDESVREATMSLIKAAGFTPEAFACADDFLRSGALGSADCLVADVHMPGMTGLELHGHLVRSGRSIPTVLVTAYPDEKDRHRALDAGVVSYLPKPFDEDELLDCIRSALKPDNSRSSHS